MGKVYHDKDGDWEAVPDWLAFLVPFVLSAIMASVTYAIWLLFNFLKAKGWL
jgi:hypothetical protein